MKTVLLIFGGCSTEYEVSLESASAVSRAIDREQYQVLHMGISRQGDAFLFEGSIDEIQKNTWMDGKCFPCTISMSRKEHALFYCKDGVYGKSTFDLAFPVLHGKNGEDGTLQGLFEMAGIPIAGCGMEASVLGMNKYLAHLLVELQGIKVPKSVLLNGLSEYSEKLNEMEALKFPVFVKPVRAGSSFGITKVLAKEQLQQAVREAFLHDSQVLIEEGIEGFEVGCAVLGTKELTIGRVDEIQLSDGFFDYTEKYTLKTSKIHMPARISASDEERIRETAGKIYRILQCKGFTRVDCFFTPQKEIVFNEINTIPGFTSHSRFPNMMKGIGMDFKTVISRILEEALQ